MANILAALSSSHTSSWPFIVVIWCAPQSNKSSRAMRTELFTSRCVKTEASADRTSFTIFAFDEGRTLPNLLGYLWSRRCPVHASESWPVFFRSIGRPFIFSAPFWMTSQFRCAKDAALCIAKNNISPLKCRTHFPNLRLLLVNSIFSFWSSWKVVELSSKFRVHVWWEGIRTFRTHGRFVRRRFVPKVEMIRTQS